MEDVETIHTLRNEQLFNALEERAAQLEAEASSTDDPKTIEAIAARGRSLLAGLPPGTPANVRMRLENAIETAEKQAADAESDGGSSALSGPGSLASLNFQNQMYRFMSKQEQQFFNSLDSNTQYQMARIREDGTVEQTDKTVSGAQLKEDFARVKYHTLSEEQREGITLPDGTKGKMTPEQEVQQLDKLDQSLENLEGYKAQQLMEDGATQEECKKCHRQFSDARDQVKNLKGRIHKAQELHENGRDAEARMENAMIEVDRHRLRDKLQKGVIDDALLDDNQERGHAISGGQHVDNERSAQLNRPHTKMDESVRQRNDLIHQ